MSSENFKETEIGLIPNDWNFDLLENHLYIKGRIGWKGLKKSEYLKKGYAIINGSNLIDEKIDWDNVGRITKERFDESPEIKLKKDDILMTKDGTIGKIAYINKLKEPTTVASGVFVIRNTSKLLYQKYLYYYFKSPYFAHLVNTRMEGSVVPHLYQKDINKISIPLPPQIIQRSIANLLESLDNKIEVNNVVNQTLEEIGQAIFKHWFVDFEFPDENGNPYKSSGGEMVDSELGEIPKGWKVKKIKNIDVIVTDYVANGSFASLRENVKIYEENNYALFVRNTDLKDDFKSTRRYVNEHAYNFLSKTKLYGGEVIISNVGDVGSVFICPFYDFPMTLGNNVIMLKSESLNNFFYYLFKSNYGQFLIKTITAGSVQLKFNKTDFRNLELVLPDSEVLKRFNEISLNLIKKIFEFKIENEKLSELRDSLLPKLMSGKIRVNIPEEATAK